MNKLEEISNSLIEKFGAENQIIKAISELGELVQALADHQCNQLASCSMGSKEHRVLEEIADVKIMLNQLEILFGREKVDAKLEWKIGYIEKMLEETLDKVFGTKF